MILEAAATKVASPSDQVKPLLHARQAVSSSRAPVLVTVDALTAEAAGKVLRDGQLPGDGGRAWTTTRSTAGGLTIFEGLITLRFGGLRVRFDRRCARRRSA